MGPEVDASLDAYRPTATAVKIAVVGSGIAGMGAAWLLSRQHEVVLFEKQYRLGGHTDTHQVVQAGKAYSVDSGFIVFNPANYPLFTRMLDELGVASQPTTMGFSVQDARSGLEYNATSLNAMFCQRSNLLSPKFIRMVREILRFYRECAAVLNVPGDGPTLGQYLAEQGYSRLFIDSHLIPMASALWSSPSERILEFPAKYLVRFMDNHHMLQVAGRPEWRVVTGGSSTYIAAMQKAWTVSVRLNSPVQSLRRADNAVFITGDDGEEHFDQVILACHSDQSLALLADPTPAEKSVLGAICYQENETVLHTDASVLPSRRAAWAAWNAHIPQNPTAQCTVSYCMNLLQSLQSPEPFIVSLNRTPDIDASKIIATMKYQHPVYSHGSMAAQAQRDRISGVGQTWYAGAYWGYGFHEDGLRSGVDVVRSLGTSW
jgi:predicted NAD/FAD-binding protein